MKKTFSAFLIGLMISCNSSSTTQTTKPPNFSSWDSGFDTSEPTIIPSVSNWSVFNPYGVADDCNIGNYQDLNSMIPNAFKIEKSNISIFETDSTVCNMQSTGNRFICETITSEEEALAGSARLKVKTTMKGNLTSSSSMDLEFDIIVESCEGSGCFMIEIALPFPCPLVLAAKGEAR